jgi:hypothetical protein
MVEIEGTFTSASEIEHAEEALGWKIDAFLRSKGWEQRSNTPGCYWMWHRTIGGVVYACHRDDAVSMQRAIEDAEWPETES